jgi:TPR repeat protein
VREQAVSELQHVAMYNPAVAEEAVRLLVKMLGDPNVTVVLAARRAMQLKSVRPIVNRLAGRYASVKTNDAFALIMLGRMYEHGVGVSKDRRKALKCFDTARKLGDSEARKEYNRLRLLVDR